MAELWTGYVLFQNDTIQGLLARIIAITGKIPAKLIKEARLCKEYFTEDMILYQTDTEEKEKSGNEIIQLMMPKQSNIKARLKTDDEEFIDFITMLLKTDPDERPTAREAMNNKFFDKV
mmetsp:Transcript_24832/g.54886  ORF Transcript_24832/g.54886 Transcript_24832/m.54886 type:complete len:119 (+) Transcript_24832:1844-2200(+)